MTSTSMANSPLTYLFVPGNRADRYVRPSEAEIAWAKRVAVAAESGSGAVQVDGRMVDRPVIAKAQRILASI